MIKRYLPVMIFKRRGFVTETKCSKYTKSSYDEWLKIYLGLIVELEKYRGLEEVDIVDDIIKNAYEGLGVLYAALLDSEIFRRVFYLYMEDNGFNWDKFKEDGYIFIFGQELVVSGEDFDVKIGDR